MTIQVVMEVFVLIKIKNVSYAVDDVHEATAFYQDALGITPQFVDGARWAQFRVDGSTFALSAGEETPDGMEAGAVITFEVDNLVDFVRGLRDKGIAVSELREMNGHGSTCWFRDPTGNVVQLYGR
jgi:catechol 2,3-dioxygenase-like lactoylglutathione lyase family enzyme